MKTTAAVLHELQNHYDQLGIRPKHTDVAKAANLPKATVTRYLNGTTKGGDPDRVRALCIALERDDLAAQLPIKPSINTPMDVWSLLAEQKIADREYNLEEVGRERQLREESEKRLISEMDRLRESKDNIIARLSDRVNKLEDDKARQTVVNEKLNAEIGKYAAMADAEAKAKRRYRGLSVVLFFALILCFAIFDLPNPDSGLFEFLMSIFI